MDYVQAWHLFLALLKANIWIIVFVAAVIIAFVVEHFMNQAAILKKYRLTKTGEYFLSKQVYRLSIPRALEKGLITPEIAEKIASQKNLFKAVSRNPEEVGQVRPNGVVIYISVDALTEYEIYKGMKFIEPQFFDLV